MAGTISPARARIASCPAVCSRQPRDPQLHSGPELAERRQVGLVADPQRQRSEPRFGCKHGGDVQVVPAEVGRGPEQAGARLDQSRDGEHGADDGEPLQCRGGHGGPGQLPRAGDRLLGREPPLVLDHHAAMADVAGQVDQADGDVVDVDLDPQSRRAVHRQIETGGGSSRADPGLRGALGDQATGDERVDQRRDRGAGQAGAGGEVGAGDRLGVGDPAEDDGQVVVAEPLLPGRAVGGALDRKKCRHVS